MADRVSTQSLGDLVTGGARPVAASAPAPAANNITRIKGNIEKMLAQGAPEADVDRYVASEGVTLKDLQTAGKQLSDGLGLVDAAKSAGVGLGEGAIEFASAGGDVRKAILDANDWVAGKISPEYQQSYRKIRSAAEPAMQWILPQASVMSPIAEKVVQLFNPQFRAPQTSEDVKKGIEENITGEFYKPQKTLGEYLHTGAKFAPNMISPGTAGRRVVASWLIPALTSETAGQLTKGKPSEGVARVFGALAGGLGATGAASLFNDARSFVPKTSRASESLLSKAIAPGAEERLSQLGPDAMLLDATPSTMGLAQGVVTKPGPGQTTLVDAVKGRQSGANQRLQADVDATLGPAVPPSQVEAAIDARQKKLSPLYEAVVGLNEPVRLDDILTDLRIQIPQEAGATASALNKIKDMIAPVVPEARGQRILKTNPREVLNVRQAVDDLLKGLGDQPNAATKVGHYRKVIDEALAAAVPDIKVLDAIYENLEKSRKALQSGAQVLKTGPEAIRPEDLIAQRLDMGLPPREAERAEKLLRKLGTNVMPPRDVQRVGTRAEIDRLVGTKANDIEALKGLIQSEGDWNRAKLTEIFGAKEAERIFNSVNREVAFQDAYKKIVENSQTAQRQGAARMINAEAGDGPSMRDTTMVGAVLAAGKWLKDKGVNAWRGAREEATSDELARALTRTGADRDQLVAAVRAAQQKRKDLQITAPEVLIRALQQLTAAQNDTRARNAH